MKRHKRKTNFLKALAMRMEISVFGKDSPPRSWFDQKVYDEQGKEIPEATNTFIGYFKHKDGKIPMYTNPTVPEGIMYFINDDIMTAPRKE